MRFPKTVKFYLISFAAYLVLTVMLIIPFTVLLIFIWLITPAYIIYALYSVALLFGLLQGIIIEALITYPMPDNYS